MADAGSSARKQPLLSHVTSDIYGAQEDETKQQQPRGFKETVFGDLDWGYLFKPLPVFLKNRAVSKFLGFRRLGTVVPMFLNIIIGVQHAGAALGPIVGPALMWGWMMPGQFGNYAVQSAFVIAGIASLVQCMQVKIPGTPYRIGMGMPSFLGNSIVFTMTFIRLVGMFVEEDKISVHDAYGKVLGTAAVCSLAYIALALVPRKYIKNLFPPIVSGLILVLVGIDSFSRGVKYWGGGILCANRGGLCSLSGDVHLPFGSSEYIGLGFMAVVIWIFADVLGTAFIRQNKVLVSLLIPFIISTLLTKDGKHYVSGHYIDDATAINFVWTTTYKLGFEAKAILPLLGAYLVTFLQANAVLAGTIEESLLDIEGEEENAFIHGGVLTTGIMSLFATLATGVPLAPIAENNTCIHTTRVASRISGIAGSIILLLLGVFGHILALVLEVPISIKGALIVCFASVVILSGLKILFRENCDARTQFIITYSFVFGLGNLVVANFIDDQLWPLGAEPSDFFHSINFAVISVMRVPYFLGGLAAILLHLMYPKRSGEVGTLPERDDHISAVYED